MCLYGMTAVSSQSVLALVMSLTETGNWCFVLEWCDVFYFTYFPEVKQSLNCYKSNCQPALQSLLTL